ncbi:MAG: hypothetical protein COB66_04510 [Coxiella sp. (in: Bacteria)]|nr:MAG: hypothetical protein COB66_04510 [Coxiella sp. (in: g-proteobacteria)]
MFISYANLQAVKSVAIGYPADSIENTPLKRKILRLLQTIESLPGDCDLSQLDQRITAKIEKQWTTIQAGFPDHPVVKAYCDALQQNEEPKPEPSPAPENFGKKSTSHTQKGAAPVYLTPPKELHDLSKEKSTLLGLSAIVTGVVSEPTVKMVQSQLRTAKNPVFFGTALGQRLHRTAHHHARDSARITTHSLSESIMAKHVDKTQWHDVANYFLLGMSKRLDLLSKKSTPTQTPLADSESLDLEQFWVNFISIQRFKGRSLEADIQRPSYTHKPDHRPHWKQSERDKMLDLLNRRACKHLMLLSHRLGHDIIYALDDINPIVAAKGMRVKVITGDAWKTKVPVCTTELRYLFRYWNHFCDGVKFVKALEVTQAPWDVADAQQDWAKYTLHLARKTLLNSKDESLIAPIEDMTLSYKRKQWKDVITTYHKLEPSRCLPNLYPGSCEQYQSSLFPDRPLSESAERVISNIASSL